MWESGRLQQVLAKGRGQNMQLCERGYGTIKHLLEEREEAERIGYSLEKVVDGRNNEKVVKWFREVEERIARKERERSIDEA